MLKRVILILVFLLSLLAGACSKQPETPQEILKAFTEALDDDNLEGALPFVAEDIHFVLFSEEYFSKNDDLSTFLKAYMVLYSDTEFFNLETSGNTVRGTLQMKGLGDAVFLGPLEVEVENGQITEYIFR